MSRYRITPRAHQDLREISSHISQHNPSAARRLLERLTETYRRLAAMPGMGREREELGTGLRSFSVPPYLIFYRESANGIEIVRVFHGARDIESLFS